MVEYQKIFDRLPLRRRDQRACQDNDGCSCVPVYLCEQRNCSSTVSEDLSQDAREKIELSVDYVVRSTSREMKPVFEKMLHYMLNILADLDAL